MELIRGFGLDPKNSGKPWMDSELGEGELWGPGLHQFPRPWDTLGTEVETEGRF